MLWRVRKANSFLSSMLSLPCSLAAHAGANEIELKGFLHFILLFHVVVFSGLWSGNIIEVEVLFGEENSRCLAW